MSSTITAETTKCFHCGEDCDNHPIVADNHSFCCNGCCMVFQLLHNSGLCAYYDLNASPGVNQRNEHRSDKFAFLDDPAIGTKLSSYTDDRQTNVTFYLPQVHC